MADSRMAEMSAVMKKRDRQADERMKLTSDMMQHRDTDANVRMVDLMTIMKDLTLGVRAIASQTAVAQGQVAPSTPSNHCAFYQCRSPTCTSHLLGSWTAQRRADETLKTGTAQNILYKPGEDKQNGESSPFTRRRNRSHD